MKSAVAPPARVLWLVVLLALPAVARADLPSPRLDRIFPLGASAGTSVEIEIQGADLEEATTLRFDQPGITAAHVMDRKFKISVAADVLAGTYDVWAIGKYGVSSPRLFLVSRDITEVLKKGNNFDAASAQVVAVNTAIHGTTDGNRENCYRFPARQGQRIAIEAQAQLLESPLEGTLKLTDADGKALASNGHYFGRDPFLDFVAPKDGEYVVAVADLSYRGGFPYRLVISDRPQVENVFPRALQAGKPCVLSIFGRNLGKDSKPSSWKINDLALDVCEETFTAPPELLARGLYQFREHPTTHSVLSTGATSTLVGYQVVPSPSGIAANPIPVLVSDTPVTLEQEPNDDPAKPQEITLPAVVAGRFDKERDADWYGFTPDADGAYSFEVYCERLGGQADPYLVVMDDKDNRVAELDDSGPRVNAFDAHVRDPSGIVNLKAKQKYRVLVQERYSRGGARYQYVLTVRKAVPDFFAAAIHHQNPGPGGTTLRRGGTAHLDVVLQFCDGFAGPVTVTAEDLPPGVHALPTVITKETKGVVVLWADAEAPAFLGPIKLLATGKRGDEEIRREVRPYTRVHPEANVNSSRPTREQLLCVLPEPAPFAVRFAQERAEVEAGQKVELAVAVERLSPDFKGPVTLLPLAFPGSLQTGTVTVAEGKGEATISVQVQAGMQPGEYTLTLTGQGQVPFTKDPTKPKANTLVASPSRPLTLVVKAAPKK